MQAIAGSTYLVTQGEDEGWMTECGGGCKEGVAEWVMSGFFARREPFRADRTGHDVTYSLFVQLPRFVSHLPAAAT